MNDLADGDRQKVLPTEQKPRILAGVLVSLLVTPFLLSIVLMNSSGGSTTARAALGVSVFALFLFAFPMDFFLGHRVKWILPSLVAVMGLVSIGFGIGVGNLRMAAFGLPLVVVGVCWGFADRLPAPLAGWIASFKATLGRDVLPK